MNKTRTMMAVAVLFALSAVEARSSTITAGTDLFGRGRFRLSAYGGAASTLNQNYALLGAGAGYYLLNGFEVGIDGEAWLGNSPKVYKVTPEIRYVLYRLQRIMPYVGAFYRRTMYEGLSDLDSYGGRAGLYTALGRKSYAGAGIVYEKLTGCDDQIYSSCSSTYPEISISVGF